MELQDWVVEEVGRHLHGEVGDEGFPGELHLEGCFSNGIGSVGHPAGDNSVSKSGRDPGVHRETVDIDVILDRGRGRAELFNTLQLFKSKLLL